MIVYLIEYVVNLNALRQTSYLFITALNNAEHKVLRSRLTEW